MKKFVSSLIALAVSAACLSGGMSLNGFAEALNTEIGELGEVGELCTGGEEYLNFSTGMPSVLSNSSAGAYNYRDFLNNNNAAVYDTLSSWVTPSLEEEIVVLPESVEVTLSSLPGTSSYTEEDQETFNNTLLSCCKSGVDSLMFDKPEIFWLDMSGIMFGVNSASYRQNRLTGTYIVTIKEIKFAPALDSAFADIDEAMEYKTKLENAVADFNVQGDTRYEQLKSIHDAISLFTYYDETAKFMSSALGALIEPGVVCEGYSEGFKLICDRLDIPCVLVFGNYDAEDNTAHMWNYVKMEDGNWYGLDLTWDDTDGAYGVDYKYQYFLKGSTNFFKNHTEEPDYLSTIFTYPELASDDYSPSQSVPVTTTAASKTTTSTTTSTETTTSEITFVTETEPETTVSETTAVATETIPSETSITETETTTAETIVTETETTSSEISVTETETTPAETSVTETETTPAVTSITETETTITDVTVTETTSAASSEVDVTETATTTSTGEIQTTTSAESTVTETGTSITETTSESTETTTEPVYERGDFNHDGIVSAADLILCAKAVLGTNADVNCDYDGDGIVNCIDLIYMRKRVFA